MRGGGCCEKNIAEDQSLCTNRIFCDDSDPAAVCRDYDESTMFSMCPPTNPHVVTATDMFGNELQNGFCCEHNDGPCGVSERRFCGSPDRVLTCTSYTSAGSRADFAAGCLVIYIAIWAFFLFPPEDA